jgi:hypothetical protein
MDKTAPFKRSDSLSCGIVFVPVIEIRIGIICPFTDVAPDLNHLKNFPIMTALIV